LHGGQRKRDMPYSVSMLHDANKKGNKNIGLVLKLIFH